MCLLFRFTFLHKRKRMFFPDQRKFFFFAQFYGRKNQKTLKTVRAQDSISLALSPFQPTRTICSRLRDAYKRYIMSQPVNRKCSQIYIPPLAVHVIIFLRRISSQTQLFFFIFEKRLEKNHSIWDWLGCQRCGMQDIFKGRWQK